MANKIDDEIIIAALVSHATIKDAAQAVGVSDRTIYSKMRETGFQRAYQCARTDLLRGAVAAVNEKVQSALETICTIKDDAGNSPQVRLNASKLILDYSERMQARFSAEENANMPQPPLGDLLKDI